MTYFSQAGIVIRIRKWSATLKKPLLYCDIVYESVQHVLSKRKPTLKTTAAAQCLWLHHSH